MDPFEGLALGFSHALTLQNLGWALLGCFLGSAVGVLPGIGPALTIALLLPITFQVSATGAFILFCGVFYGAMYGGSTTSILLNTPGESGSIITALDGARGPDDRRSEEHTSELQSRQYLVCRLLLEKK